MQQLFLEPGTIASETLLGFPISGSDPPGTLKPGNMKAKLEMTLKKHFPLNYSCPENFIIA